MMDDHHQNLMNTDEDYAAGYRFIQDNQRHYNGDRPDEIRKMAQWTADMWSPHDDNPNSFALGAAAALLELAVAKEAI
jgi:hypothetical protein